jgi:hypothetical protein
MWISLSEGKSVFNAFLIFYILKKIMWDKKRLNHTLACG